MQEATASIPKHLHPFIAKQDPSLYTAIDHASWRYIMKLSREFFAKTAHDKYLEGLEKTGINTDRIPLISEMDEKLQKFGWRAIPIIGFIPPAPFLEFLSLGILPIACDMRKVENIHYTPAPDIVHEAAGHAPILADPGFAKYLLSYGEIARKVIFTDKDEALYDAIRALSDLKENPRTTQAQIDQAQADLEKAVAEVTEVSEAALLTRMAWWTFEYGLIGPMENPKIYGAGLLSSVGESYNCFSPHVKKIPFSIDCINQAFDITKPQPQLFVTPDFETLMRELDKLANLMAFRIGGLEALKKAHRAKTVTTSLLDSGLQIGGKIVEIIESGGAPAYLRFEGPVQLGYKDRQLQGQGPKYHHHGFGTPVGVIKKLNKSPAELSDSDLKAMGFDGGKSGVMEFASGVTVTGVLKDKIVRDGRTLVLCFNDCTVKDASGRVLFQPSWGTFDMACGLKVTSVYGGAPDRTAYIEETVGFNHVPPAQSSNLIESTRELNELYAKVRFIRTNWKAAGRPDQDGVAGLQAVLGSLDEKYPREWLLRYEILELVQDYKLNVNWSGAIRKTLADVAKDSQDKADLINRGLQSLH